MVKQKHANSSSSLITIQMARGFEQKGSARAKMARAIVIMRGLGCTIKSLTVSEALLNGVAELTSPPRMAEEQGGKPHKSSPRAVPCF